VAVKMHIRCFGMLEEIQSALIGCPLSQCSQSNGEDKLRLEASGSSGAAPCSSSRADSLAHADGSDQV
jgi:hypothetical protein